MTRQLDRNFTDRMMDEFYEDEESDLGKILRQGPDEAVDYTKYQHDPLGFFREVLHDDKLYDKQIEVIMSVLHEPQTTVKGCHSAGKDHVAAGLGLWFAYCMPGRTKVMITGPTQHQVDEILFEDELARAHHAGDLPGEMRSHTLRIPGDPKRLIFGRVSTEIARLTGHHAPYVMIIITEAQDSRVSDIAFTAARGNATGPNDKILVVGNPTEPIGEFHRTHQQNSGWSKITMPYTAHPNIVQKREVIPGGPSMEWLEKVRKDEGEDSLFWQTRVLAEFPKSASDSLLRDEWIDAAVRRYQDWQIRLGAGLIPPDNDVTKSALAAGVDVARFGGDSSVVCIIRGFMVIGFVTWNQTDTVVTETNIAEALRRYGFEQKPDGGLIRVDEGAAGGGAGVMDHLAAAGWAAEGFDGSRPPPVEPDRYENTRSWAYWSLRMAFEKGVIAIPNDRLLIEELKAITYKFGNRDGILISKKHEIKKTLHRSPDRADALMMAWSVQEGGITEGGAAGNFGF